MSEQGEKQEGRILPHMGGREQVEKTADRLRDELLLTLEELERRRAHSLDVRHQLRHLLVANRELLRKVGGAALGLLVLGVGYSRWQSRRRKRLLWERRREALRRAWEHPDRVASVAEERPLPVELGRKVVLIFGTALAAAMARNAVALLVPPRDSSGDEVTSA